MNSILNSHDWTVGGKLKNDRLLWTGKRVISYSVLSGGRVLSVLSALPFTETNMENESFNKEL